MIQFDGGVDHLNDPFFDFLVDDCVVFEGGTFGVDESWNDDAAEIEHQGICKRHDGHVAGTSASSAEEGDGFVLPAGAAGEFKQVLGGTAAVEIVYCNSEDDCGCFLDFLCYFNYVWIGVCFVAIAVGQLDFAEVEPVDF